MDFDCSCSPTNFIAICPTDSCDNYNAQGYYDPGPDASCTFGCADLQDCNDGRGDINIYQDYKSVGIDGTTNQSPSNWDWNCSGGVERTPVPIGCTPTSSCSTSCTTLVGDPGSSATCGGTFGGNACTTQTCPGSCAQHIAGSFAISCK
jgi:hypothetical protein